MQQRLNRLKYIHVTIVVLGTLLPLCPVVAGLAIEGFVIDAQPPFLCVSRSADVAYYTLALPISLLMAVGIILLLAVLWKIMEVRLY